MLTELSPNQREDPLVWRARYKRLVHQTYDAFAKEAVLNDWQAHGVPDARFRLHYNGDTAYKVQGIMFCKLKRLCSMWQDTDFERRAQWGDTLFGNVAWEVEESLDAGAFGTFYVIKTHTQARRLFWEHHDAVAATWTFVFCACNSRLDPEAPPPEHQWTVFFIKGDLEKDVDYNERCYVRIMAYNEPACMRDAFLLTDQVEMCEAFCRNKTQWNALYSPNAKTERDLERRDMLTRNEYEEDKEKEDD